MVRLMGRLYGQVIPQALLRHGVCFSFEFRVLVNGIQHTQIQKGACISTSHLML